MANQVCRLPREIVVGRKAAFIMDIKIIPTPEGDTVELRGAPHVRLSWDAWLRSTETAVKAIRRALDAKTWDNVTYAMYRSAAEGATWLSACGVTDRADFESLEQRLPLMHRAATPANAMRCRRCNSRIWGREALATGLGSCCRRGGASHAVRALRAAAQGVTA